MSTLIVDRRTRICFSGVIRYCVPATIQATDGAGLRAADARFGLVRPILDGITKDAQKVWSRRWQPLVC